MGQSQYTFDFRNLRLKMHGYDLITTLEVPIRIHHNAISETAIQWCSLKCNRWLKSHPNISVNKNYMELYCKRKGLFSVIRFNIRLLTFVRQA